MQKCVLSKGVIVENDIDKSLYPEHIQESILKAERAIAIGSEIFQICLEHAKSDDQELLLKCGSLLGDFVNNLRSSLNYTMRGIINREVIPKLSSSKKNKFERKMDFPWSISEKKFESKQSIKILREVDEPLFKRIRRFQPYIPGNEWLGQLMKLSNKDKHVVLNKVQSPTASTFLAFLPDGTQLKEPWFTGEHLVIFSEEGPKKAKLPYYYEPLNAFATPRHTWSLYIIPVEERYSLDLVKFTQTTPLKVVYILAALEALYESFPTVPGK